MSYTLAMFKKKYVKFDSLTMTKAQQIREELRLEQARSAAQLRKMSTGAEEQMKKLHKTVESLKEELEHQSKEHVSLLISLNIQRIKLENLEKKHNNATEEHTAQEKALQDKYESLIEAKNVELQALKDSLAKSQQDYSFLKSKQDGQLEELNRALKESEKLQRYLLKEREERKDDALQASQHESIIVTVTKLFSMMLEKFDSQKKLREDDELFIEKAAQELTSQYLRLKKEHMAYMKRGGLHMSRQEFDDKKLSIMGTGNKQEY